MQVAWTNALHISMMHTRGTDIKFPLGFCTAVILGPKVAKDRLTQGISTMQLEKVMET